MTTGWLSPLVQGVIQNITHNLRFAIVPNAFLVLVALGFYWCVNLEGGIADASKDYSIS